MKTTSFTPILITPCIDKAYLQNLPLYAESASWLMYRHINDEFIDKFLEITRPLSHKTLLLNLPFASPNQTIALSSRFDGVHLKSNLLEFIAPLRSYFLHNKIIGYSAHSVDEVESALAFGADYCTLSPIYPSPNKGTPLGLETLKKLPQSLRSHIVALGGIKRQHIQELMNLGLFGFAGIGYFLES